MRLNFLLYPFAEKDVIFVSHRATLTPVQPKTVESPLSHEKQIVKVFLPVGWESADFTRCLVGFVSEHCFLGPLHRLHTLRVSLTVGIFQPHVQRASGVGGISFHKYR